MTRPLPGIIATLATLLSLNASAQNFMFSVGTGMSLLQDEVGIAPGSINTRFGYAVSPRIIITGGADYSGVGLSTKYKDRAKLDESYNLLTLHGGAKFFFGERTAHKVAVYDAAGIFTIIPFASSDDDSTSSKFFTESYSFGFYNGLGAEYFFADAFSVGAEAGLNVFFGGWSRNDDSASAYAIDLYTGFSLNFYL